MNNFFVVRLLRRAASYGWLTSRPRRTLVIAVATSVSGNSQDHSQMPHPNITSTLDLFGAERPQFSAAGSANSSKTCNIDMDQMGGLVSPPLIASRPPTHAGEAR